MFFVLFKEGMMYVFMLAFFQNVSFSMVSRARNRNSLKYHLFTAIVSNTVWYLTFRELVLGAMNFYLFIPYTIGTVAGSLIGAKVSMWIEARLGAASDSHIKSGAQITTAVMNITKSELIAIISTELETFYNDKIVRVEPLQEKVVRQRAQLVERQEINRLLHPPLNFAPKYYKASSRWKIVDNAGQCRLSF